MRHSMRACLPVGRTYCGIQYTFVVLCPRMCLYETIEISSTVLNPVSTTYVAYVYKEQKSKRQNFYISSSRP